MSSHGLLHFSQNFIYYSGIIPNSFYFPILSISHYSQNYSGIISMYSSETSYLGRSPCYPWCSCQARTQGGSVDSNVPPRCTKSVRLSNVILGLAAILYTCQEMQYTDTLQTRAYQKSEQLEVQLEGGARVLLIHL